MSLGDYDEQEYERRERKSNTVDAAFDDERNEYDGTVEYEGDESAEDLLDQFQEMKSD